MSKMTKGLMSSDKQDWETPQEFVDLLPVDFDLDACAYPKTAKAKKYFTEADNALEQKWKGNVWMNPPYGRAIPEWLAYAYEQSRQAHNTSVWCLVPARPDTAWFHEYATKGKVIFLKGRVSFLQDGKSVGSPAFPSMLVVFNKKIKPGFETWNWKKDLKKAQSSEAA